MKRILYGVDNFVHQVLRLAVSSKIVEDEELGDGNLEISTKLNLMVSHLYGADLSCVWDAYGWLFNYACGSRMSVEPAAVIAKNISDC